MQPQECTGIFHACNKTKRIAAAQRYVGHGNPERGGNAVAHHLNGVGDRVSAARAVTIDCVMVAAGRLLINAADAVAAIRRHFLAAKVPCDAIVACRLNGERVALSGAQERVAADMPNGHAGCHANKRRVGKQAARIVPGDVVFAGIGKGCRAERIAAACAYRQRVFTVPPCVAEYVAAAHRQLQGCTFANSCVAQGERLGGRVGENTYLYRVAANNAAAVLRKRVVEARGCGGQHAARALHAGAHLVPSYFLCAVRKSGQRCRACAAQ